ncbi:unnamed protein product [Ectocarpus sp. 12 AP-2014]
MRLRQIKGEAALLAVAAMLTSATIVPAEDQHKFRNKFLRVPPKGPRPLAHAQQSPASHTTGVDGNDGSSSAPEHSEVVPPAAAAAPGVAVEGGCPYVIDTAEEAISRIKDKSLPGNVVKVEHLTFCRTGNHFSSFFRNLALGYCCKSKVVWLPPKDDVLAPGVLNQGTPGPRWFDFSSAPDVDGFDSSACSADITWAGKRAFHMHQLDSPEHEFHTPGLKECIARAPRLLACEAAYYFPKDVDLCHATAAAAAPSSEHNRQSSYQGGWPDDLERRRRNRRLGGGDGDESIGKDGAGAATTGGEGAAADGGGQQTQGENEEGVEDEEMRPAGEEEREQGGGGGGGGGDGNLVLHVRSGDIFSDKVLAYYGQPPLQFYLQVIQHADWDSVDIVTNAQERDGLNPVVPALQAMVDAGDLPDSVHVHTNRTMEEDLLSMFCADGLALARSTLVSLTGFHSKAKRVYGPHQCNPQFKQLALFRPEVQAYGVDWAGEYGVYKSWENTPDQREEMLAYDKIVGFNQCSGE